MKNVLLATPLAYPFDKRKLLSLSYTVVVLVLDHTKPFFQFKNMVKVKVISKLGSCDTYTFSSKKPFKNALLTSI